jgi:hypothetical protein
MSKAGAPTLCTASANREADMTASVHPPAGGPDQKPQRPGEAVGQEDRAFGRPTPKEHQDNLLDEGIEETFPASDPVSVSRVHHD